MNFLFPTLAALLQAASFTIDKATLSLKKVSFKTYLGVSFPLLFLIELIVFVLIQPPLYPALFSDKTLFLFATLVILTVAGNLLYYRALDSDRLYELDTINLLTAVPTLLWAHVIFTDERKPFLLFLALVASLAIVWSHWERHHFRVAKLTMPFFIWTVTLGPFGDIISKELLRSLNPIVMVLVRDGIVALIFGTIFFKYLERISSRAFLFLLATNILSSVAWILYYFSFQTSGIIYTILIFSLMPLLVYFGALVFLKEPFRWKKFTAFLIVLVSIVIAQITA